MKLLHNEKGIALVTSLMFTAIALVISMYLLYMVTVGIQTSGAMKRYHTAIEATYGGADIIANNLIIAGFVYNKDLVGTAYTTKLTNTYMASLQNPTVSSCFQVKLTKPRSQWGTCADTTDNAKTNFDISFDLNAASGAPFTIYSKIVDTMERNFLVLEDVGGVKTPKIITAAGNSDLSTGSTLNLGATTESSPVTVPHYPYVYRIEVQGERKTGPAERGKLSILYAY